ncbi:uncharacterized protein BKCO1_21000125 [Diplodia corticola]|uniref:Uncharacterized protein n=1 Tax=Diplodia corticola TaxID=236234 RepID=A0A1J9S3Y8_9PEZI|nr:uncharacterized protein BKCO1_21000125 [Diplodia corticola]OJD34708.1 hypothetical protein BKCO1_21000125 [Diplodia corticola]
MRTTTFVAATAAYASAASAHPYLYTRQANVTAQWGSWVVTSPSSNYPPSGSHKSLDFLVRYESQADTVHCGAYFPGTAKGIGPNQTYTPCDDEAVSFTSDLSIGNVWITQKLYQRSAIVMLKGSAPLHLYGGNCTTDAVGGGTCSSPPFKIPVTSVSIQLANGTVVGDDSTSPGNGVQGDDAAGGSSEEGSQDSGSSQDDGSLTDDYSGSGTAGSSEDTTTSGDDGSSDQGSSYGDGGPYGNTTVLNDGHGSRNTTWHGSHSNDTRHGHYA